MDIMLPNGAYLAEDLPDTIIPHVGQFVRTPTRFYCVIRVEHEIIEDATGPTRLNAIIYVENA